MVVTDPGVNDTVSLSIDWGDGKQSSIPAGNIAPELRRHFYDKPGQYVVSVVAASVGLGSAKVNGVIGSASPRVTVNLTVTNVAPAVVARLNRDPAIVLKDGDRIELSANVSDVGVNQHLVSWEAIMPSGQKVAPVGASPGFLPMESGIWSAKVFVDDQLGGVANDTLTFVIQNSDPSSLTLAESGVVTDSQVRTFSGSVKDFVADTVHGSIIFQDLTSGQINELPLVLTPNGAPVNGVQEWEYSISHVFQNASENLVTVKITDNDGGLAISPAKTVKFENRSNALLHPPAANGNNGPKLGDNRTAAGPVPVGPVQLARLTSDALVQASSAHDGFRVRDLRVGRSGTATVNVVGLNNSTAVADVWIDFNLNFSFEDPGEHVVDSRGILSNGDTEFTVAVPAIAKPGSTVARVRLSSPEDGDLTSTSFASSGEVEDHAVSIGAVEILKDEAGNLVLDSLGDRPDQLTVDSNGNSIRIRFDISDDVFLRPKLIDAGASKDSTNHVVSVPLSVISGHIKLSTSEGNDQVAVTVGNGLPNVDLDTGLNAAFVDEVTLNGTENVDSLQFAAVTKASSVIRVNRLVGPTSELSVSGRVALRSEIEAKSITVDYRAADNEVSILPGSVVNYGLVVLSNQEYVAFKSPSSELIVKADEIELPNRFALDVKVDLEASDIQVEAGMDVAGLAFHGDVDLEANVTFDTQSGLGDGSVVFDGRVDGSFSLTLETGGGETRFEESIGSIEPLTGLFTDAGTGVTRFAGGEVIALDREFGDTVALHGTTRFDAVDVVFHEPVISEATSNVALELDVDHEAVAEDAIQDGAMTLSVRNIGAGTTRLQGINTYTGETQVHDGEFLLEASAELAAR